MNHESSNAPVADLRLSALYQEALGGHVDMPSAEADRRVLMLAAGGVRPPRAAAPVESAWRAWLHAQWFRPGLAFAAIASLSVVIVALMPKDDMSVERAERLPAASPAPAASKIAPESPGAAATSSASPVAPTSSVVTQPQPQPSAAAAAAAQPSTAAALSADAGTAQPPADKSRAQQSARADALGGADKEAPAKVTSTPGSLNQSAAVAARADTAVARNNKTDEAPRRAPPMAESTNAGSASAPVPFAASPPAAERERPDPFPAQSSAQSPAPLRQRAESAPAASSFAPAASTVAPAAPAVAPASPSAADAAGNSAAAPVVTPPAAAERFGPRPGKASLQSESSESRLAAANQPLPEVRDAAPTYANEPPPSTAPSSARTQRAGERETGAAGALPGAPAPQSAARGMLSKRESDNTLAAAAHVRNPYEWLKTIEKLRVDGKTEQVAKELAEFRRSYPLHPLPDALKAFIPR